MSARGFTFSTVFDLSDSTPSTFPKGLLFTGAPKGEGLCVFSNCVEESGLPKPVAAVDEKKGLAVGWAWVAGVS